MIMKIEIKVMRNILKLLVFIPLLTACGDFFTPANENIRDLSPIYKEPQYAQGLMLNAYNLLPYSNTSVSDVATDDAVSNDIGNAYLKMATGSWTSFVDPMTQWQPRKNAIQYLNIFLQNVDSVNWASDAKAKIMFRDRLKGEAYALRAVQMFGLLQAHGGWNSAKTKLLGVPIITKPESITSDFNQPRNTFQECLDIIYSDITNALNLLPVDFGDLTDATLIPAKYQAIGVTNTSDYNRVFGSIVRGRITGRIIEAIRAQVSLLAASPAYSAGTTVNWTKAADDAAIVLDRINNVSGIQSIGNTWYLNADEITNLASGATPAEIIWRTDKGNTNNDQQPSETDNYPPSVFGKGRVNPSQNLVDAFPAANGYPISDPLSNYNPQNPYNGRDPRLAKYIVLNESKQASTNGTIITGTYGTTTDALNKQSGSSTRTGYYLRKTTRPDVNLDPSARSGQVHYYARIRYTELFLDYAEAANEAWGPQGKGTHTYSAYDVVKAIRNRAGIPAADPYLESVKNDAVAMRALIRNERRLELCFENKRFYDLRRWKVDLTALNQPVYGMQIDKNTDGTLKYTQIPVEVRTYKDYMYYGPVPYSEILKWSLLEQNNGW